MEVSTTSRYNLKKVIDTTVFRRRRYRRICELTDLQRDDKVLGVGCGIGYSYEIFNSVNKIIGLDLYPEQRIFRENFRYVVGDADDMHGFGDKEFDVVVCSGVLEHIFPFEKLKRVAQEIEPVGKT